MESSRTRNSARNIVWGALNRIVSIIFPFIVRTVFIKVLGEEYLGLNSLYSSVLQVLSLAELGFSHAIVASMYKPIAKQDVEKVSALLNLYKKIYRVIGITILCIGIILTPFMHLLINGEAPIGINIYILWLLYLANTAVSYLFFAYKVSLINAHQRNDLTERIGTLCRIVTSIAQVLIVVILKSVYLYVFLTIICTVSYNFFCSLECGRRYPQFKCKGKLDSETKNKIVKDIGALTIQKIGNTVSLSLDAIIISSFLGLRTVAIYGNYFYIIQAISIFVNLIYSSITASIGNSIAVESIEKNYKDFHKIFFLNTWIIGWCTICLICLFQDFMVMWMGKELLFTIEIVLILALRFFFEQIRKVVLTYKDAAGIWWVDKWRPLVGCIVNLLLNIVLVKYVGVAGVAISTIVSYVLVEHPWETKALFGAYFKRKLKEYYFLMMKYIFSLVVAGLFTFSICSFVAYNGIVGLGIKLIICIVIPNLTFVYIHRRNSEYKSAMALMKQIVKRD